MVGHTNRSNTGFKGREGRPEISEVGSTAAIARTSTGQRGNTTLRMFCVGAIAAETIFGCGVPATARQPDVPTTMHSGQDAAAERSDATPADDPIPDAGIDSIVPFDNPQVDVPRLPELAGACPTLAPAQCIGPLAMVARTIRFGDSAWFGSFAITVSAADPIGGLPAVNVGTFNPPCGEWGGGGWHMRPTPRQEGERLSLNVYEGRTADGGTRVGDYWVQVRRVDATAATVAVIRNCAGYCNSRDVSRTGDLSAGSPRLELPTVALTMLRILPRTVYFELEKTVDCEGVGCRVRFNIPIEPDGRVPISWGVLPPDVHVEVSGAVRSGSVDGGIIDGGSTRDGGVDGSTGVVVRTTVTVQVCSYYDSNTYGDAGHDTGRDVPPSDAYASMCALTSLSPFSCRANPYQKRVLMVSPTGAPGTEYLSLGTAWLAIHDATLPTETTSGSVRYAVWYDRCRNGGFSSVNEGESVLRFSTAAAFSLGVPYIIDSRRATVDLRYAEITRECPAPTISPPVTLTDLSTRTPISRIVLTVGSTIRFAGLDGQLYSMSIIGSPRLAGSEYVADLLVVKPGASGDELVMRHRFDSSPFHDLGRFMVPDRDGHSAVFYGVHVESMSADAAVVTITGVRELQP